MDRNQIYKYKQEVQKLEKQKAFFDGLYKYKKGEDQIKAESDIFFEIGNVFKTTDGLKQLVTDCEYPRSGYTSPDMLYAAGQVKRLFVRGLELWPLVFVRKEKLMDIFVDVSFKIMSPYIYLYDNMTPFGQELYDITYNFLIKMGFKEIVALRFAEIFSNIVDCDNAYRLRGIDLFSVTYKEELATRPIRTIKYILKKASERDIDVVSIKFKRLGWLLSLVLLVPKIRRAFKETIMDSNFEKLQVDDAEWFWMCLREDYKFGGFSNEQRKSILESKGWRVPTSKKFNNLV